MFVCLTIIGEFIALHDDYFSERYIMERDLLGILARTLDNGSQDVRKQALWILQNIACGQKSADLMTRSETMIFGKIVIELTSEHPAIRTEAALCLASLFLNATIDEAMKE